MNPRMRRMQIIQRVSDAWEQEFVGSVSPEKQYSTDGDSQYPEGLVHLSASPEQHDELISRINRALESAGF